MEETTLLFRHLPTELSADERKDLLHYLGASKVKIMGRAGPMKNTAFAVFGSKEQATKVLNQLHQAEFLGSKLVVEFAKKELPPAVSVVDNEGVPDKAATDDNVNDSTKKKEDRGQHTEPREIKFDSTFSTWGLRHPRRPELRYLYPPPTPSILTNIMNALAAVPKFYVQVLHLMNKMDLPAPFGPVTAAPPIRHDIREPTLPDDIDQREMDISSETESELESESGDETEKRLTEDHTVKRILKPTKKRVAKRPRLSDLQDSGTPLEPSTTVVRVSEVFEQVTDTGASTRKIELKLPSAILPPTVTQQPLLQAHLYNFSVPPPLPTSLPLSDSVYRHDITAVGQMQQQQQQQHRQLQVSDIQNAAASLSAVQAQKPQQQQQQQQNLPQQPPVHSFYHGQQSPPPLPKVPPTDEVGLTSGGGRVQTVQSPAIESEGQHLKESEAVTTGGFGIIVPVHKEAEKEPTEDSTEKEWSKSKFISSSELRRSRLSSSEIKELSVFKRYSEGEPSCRLYIKNLARHVTEEDIHWIYGRYVDWDNEMESNIFDIRLMKEGRMKGQAFVTLPSEKVAMTALKDTNGFVLKDKPMVVQFARSAKAQEDSTSKS